MKQRLIYLTALIMFSITYCTQAQVLDEHSKIDLILADSTKISLYTTRQLEAEGPTCYYYLPVNLRIPKKDSIPQFSFMAFDSNDDKKVDGAVLHLMLTWGLTVEQEQAAEQLLQANTDSTTWIMGGISLQTTANDFKIQGNSELANLLLKKLKNHSQVPVFPGQKLAVSMLFNAEEAQAMQKMLEDKNALEKTHVEFRFEYGLGLRPQGDLILRRNFHQLLNPTF